MRSQFRNKTSRALSLQSLEARDVPAIVADLAVSISSAGVLSITGDDKDSGVTLKIVGDVLTITPDTHTNIKSGTISFGAGTPHDFPGTKSIKATLKGGNDTIAINPGFDFLLPGDANFDMGDGNNTLDMTALANSISLGSLKYKGGDGTDTIKMDAAANSGTVTGNASIDVGTGSGVATIADVKFHGSGGLKLSATKISGSVGLLATNVTVDKGLTTSNVVPYGGFTLDTCVIGSLTQTGLGAAAQLKSTTVNGNVSLNGQVAAQLSAPDTTINGNVTLKSGLDSEFLYKNTAVTGDVSVTGAFAAYLEGPLSGTGGFSAKNVTVTSNTAADARFDTSTTKATINGNLIVSGKLASEVTFATPSVSEVFGNISLKGATFASQFQTNEFFRADKDVTVKLGDGTNSVMIGSGIATVPIAGKLNITGGKGSDLVTLSNVSVAGATTINLGAGADSLTIDKNSVFTGTFSADMGVNDDIISIATTMGGTAAVKFNAKATIKGGAGNDTLKLGVAGGDAGQAVTFVAAGNKVDGGTQVNQFDDELGSFTGVVLSTDIVNWIDPT